MKPDPCVVEFTPRAYSLAAIRAKLNPNPAVIPRDGQGTAAGTTFRNDRMGRRKPSAVSSQPSVVSSHKTGLIGPVLALVAAGVPLTADT